MGVNVNYNYDYDDKLQQEEFGNRQLTLYDEIDEISAECIMRNIIKWNREDRGLPVEERKPIVISIYSYGGAVTAGLSIIDLIKASITPVITVNIGVCYSMAFYIFLAGSKRYAFQNATFLLHDGSTFSYGTTHKEIDRMEFEKTHTEKRIKDFVINNSKITSKLYDKNLRKEWYFYSDEAKELGVVDYIIGADCDINSIINKYVSE